jgi:hypothetical protein
VPAFAHIPQARSRTRLFPGRPEHVADVRAYLTALLDGVTVNRAVADPPVSTTLRHGYGIQYGCHSSAMASGCASVGRPAGSTAAFIRKSPSIRAWHSPLGIVSDIAFVSDNAVIR